MLPLFAATIFLSAFLLFGVQPMFTKMVLPILGGSPSVWSIAMVFFQALLLAGYAYANLLASRLRSGVAIAVHVSVMLAAMTSLPISVVAFGDTDPSGAEAFWLLGVFTASVGLPFFALSANGPLLQVWFSRLGGKRASDPYFLYAASNAGSFLALLAYPLLIEPWLRLGAQSLLWASLYGVLGMAIAICGFFLIRRSRNVPAAHPIAGEGSNRRVTWQDRASWAAFAFVPSGLLVAVTAHIATDVASAPFLWVAPLALFLLTFIVVFRENSFASSNWFKATQVIATAFVFLVLLKGAETLALVTVHLSLFFINALVCHRALYERRPDARNLTSFYLWMSAGGVMGGIFSGLMAPVLFSGILEYPILLVAALAAGRGITWERVVSKEALPGLAAGGLLVLCGVLMLATDLARPGILFLTGVLLIILMIVSWRRAIGTVMIATACALTVTVFADLVVGSTSYRSFFGVNKVYESPDGQFRYIRHGSTIHGAMRIRTADGQPVTGRPEPLTYYTPFGSNALGIDGVRQARGGRLDRVAAVGLGSGSIACSIRDGEDWTFFEIDPVVTRIATNPALFSFMSSCAPKAPVVHGDARLTLQKAEKPFDVIFLDAFSSDSVPAHLLTVEALQSYSDRLWPDGAIVMHISNRHLDLRAIVARAAAEVGMVTYAGATESSGEGGAASVTLVIARQAEDIGRIAGTWTLIQPDMERSPWTDDYSNILEGIRDAWLGPKVDGVLIKPVQSVDARN
ncbi:fused MFS/spermidine synthase [Microvirga sp. BT688]|uniref:fused MFS/spermidine synthase n=1 Tax=Microvirga sp. TaxID=1873136 RepID=UPI0016888CCD|nr:fused MFS/spermidine synthase [Microvirga sp.]MBD2745708.1 fused MFS/spermidine synthase [Microvirga sp.]